MNDSYYSTRWRIWPTLGAVEMNIWTTHQCDARVIRTNMANVPLN